MFSLRTENDVKESIHFTDTHIIPQNLETYIKKFYSLPNHISLSVELGEFAIFPDVFLKPFPMVSEMVLDVMRMYRVEPFFKQVTLNDRYSGEYKIYFLLYVDEKTESLYQDFELKRLKGNEITCVISLDFAESILRRDAQGIELIECNGEE